MSTEQMQQANKEAIRHLYEGILNHRDLDALSTLVSDEYTGINGEKGPEAFRKQLLTVLNAMPDAQWRVKDIVAEGNTVIIRQELHATQTGAFQGLAPTGRSVVNEGVAFYEFKDGKIIHNQVQTDRLSFLQQLGLVPADLTALQKTAAGKETVYFVDKFSIPAGSLTEFTERMSYNRHFIHSLEGFVHDEVMQHRDENGNYIIITIATWKSQAFVDKAKTLVTAEYQRIHFDPAAFYRRLNIQMERGLYSSMEE